MSFKVSTGLKNQMLNAIRGGVKPLASLQGGWLGLYSGSQPANADAAATGTLLLKVTQNSGAYTPGSYATADADSLCLSSTPGAAGVIPRNGVSGGTLVLGAYVTITGTGNESTKIFRITGTDNDDAAQIEYLQGPNNSTVSTVNTFKTVTEVYVSAATAAAITVGHGITNGLFYNLAASGQITKHSDQIWSGLGLANGVAGWFRHYGSAADDGSYSTTLPRLDGRIATSGAELNSANNTSIVLGATTTIDTWPIAWPTTL